MSKAVVTDERSKRVPQDATDAMVKAALDCNWEYEDETGLVHNIWHAMYAAAPLSHGAEAVEPEQKPVGFIITEALAELKKHKDASATVWSGLNSSHPFIKEATALFTHPVRSAQEAVEFLLERLAEFERRIDDIDDEREYQGHVAPAVARVRAAILPPGGETATQDSPAPESHMVGDQHPDDIAVDRFAAAMKAKLAKKRGEGRGGWDNPDECSIAFLSELLREHVAKGDPVDVGNLAMMIHQRGGSIE